MHCLRPFLAGILALCMAAFPLTVTGAAAAATVASQQSAPIHFQHALHAEADQHAIAESAGHAAPAHQHASDDPEHDTATGCCGNVSCHFFQVSVAPSLKLNSQISVSALACGSDQQVQGTQAGRLDRPPKIDLSR